MSMIISLLNVIYDNTIHIFVFKNNMKANNFKNFVKCIFLKKTCKKLKWVHIIFFLIQKIEPCKKMLRFQAIFLLILKKRWPRCVTDQLPLNWLDSMVWNYISARSAQIIFGLFCASNHPIYNLYNIVMYWKYILTETNVWYYEINSVEKILIFI